VVVVGAHECGDGDDCGTDVDVDLNGSDADVCVSEVDLSVSEAEVRVSEVDLSVQGEVADLTDAEWADDVG